MRCGFFSMNWNKSGLNPYWILVLIFAIGAYGQEPETPSKPEQEPDTAIEKPENPAEPEALAQSQANPNPTQTVPSPPPLGPVTSYAIQATLSPDQKKIYGHQTLHYTNHSPDIISDLRFHLYLNAAKNAQSTYWKESFGSPGTNPDTYGYIHIRSAAVDGFDVTQQLETVTSPDSAPDDETVLRVPLNGPLLPGGTVEVVFEFVSKLPLQFDRTGYAGDYFFVAQWFPKIGVWETKGFRGAERSGWNCHTFHNQTEFFANFGNYRVDIEVPSHFLVGATGQRVGKTETATTVIHQFRQDRVHDFAFVASPDFLTDTRTFDPAEWISESELEEAMTLHGLPRDEVTLSSIEMNLFIQKENRSQTDRHFEALINAIKYFGLWYGPYPYESITMVDPPRDGRFSGGMEYPTLITLGTTFPNWRSDLSLEDVTVHEFGHQYWYGMVASNEFEEPWMDEGFTSYTTQLVLDHVYGPQPIYDYLDIAKLRVPLNLWLGIENPTQRMLSGQSALQEKGRDQLTRFGWRYYPGMGYWRNAYDKPAHFLVQLEREIGKEAMERCMRTYFKEWSFRHPTGTDFFDVVSRETGRDMSWFYRELFDKPGRLAYRVGNVFSNRLTASGGYVEGDDGLQWTAQSESLESSLWRNRVTIHNDGNIHYPVPVLIKFEDGSQVRENWDGSYPWKQFVYDHPSTVASVIIDPENVLVIDDQRSNNTYRVAKNNESSKRWSARLLIAAQNLLQTLAGGL